MPRGVGAAKPDMISAIQTAIKQYVDGGTAEGANPGSLADALGQAIGNAVHEYVKDAKVQADIGSGAVLPSNFTTLTPVAGIPVGGTVVPNAPGAPILTRPGTGKLS